MTVVYYFERLAVSTCFHMFSQSACVCMTNIIALAFTPTSTHVYSQRKGALLTKSSECPSNYSHLAPEPGRKGLNHVTFSIDQARRPFEIRTITRERGFSVLLYSLASYHKCLESLVLF